MRRFRNEPLACCEETSSVPDRRLSIGAGIQKNVAALLGHAGCFNNTAIVDNRLSHSIRGLGCQDNSPAACLDQPVVLGKGIDTP